jgi:hypothetical protein
MYYTFIEQCPAESFPDSTVQRHGNGSVATRDESANFWIETADPLSGFPSLAGLNVH